MDLKIIYEDKDLLVVDKPAGIVGFDEKREGQQSVAEILTGQYPELEKLGEKHRYGIVHRLDKDTSGVLLVAKTKKRFEELQKQFQAREVEKTYICLIVGATKEDSGTIHTLLARSPNNRRRQKAFSLEDTGEGRREAVTEWKVSERYAEYTLLQVMPKTGRKHQIRAHMAHIHHPIAGDILYGFKNQPTPEDLKRQFLHAYLLKIPSHDGELTAPLPEDLQNILNKLEAQEA